MLVRLHFHHDLQRLRTILRRIDESLQYLCLGASIRYLEVLTFLRARYFIYYNSFSRTATWAGWEVSWISK